MKKGSHTPEKNTLAERIICSEQSPALLPHETAGTIPDRQSWQSAQAEQALGLLQRITALQQSESASYPDDLPTSFVAVERAIAQCISECLPDVPARKRGISHIQALLRDYRVVGFVPCQTPSVSLQRVHSILQDNYADSYLCRLMNILLAGFMQTQTKVITFF